MAGKQAGGDKNSGTRSSLMYETIRIVEKIKPKYVIWENVKNLLSKKHKHNFDSYIETMNKFGYTSYYQVLNAKDYGIPQNRERVFTISIRNDLNQKFEFPEKQNLDITVKDILETNVNDKYKLTESNKNNLKRNFGSKGKEINIEDESPTLTASMGTGGGNIPYFSLDTYYYRVCPSMLKALKEGKVKDISNAIYSQTVTTKQARWNNARLIKESCNYIDNKYKGYIEQHNEIPDFFNPYNSKKIENVVPTQTTQCGNGSSYCGVTINQGNGIYRYLTEKECFRLMGFDDEDYEKASKVNNRTQIYKQAGNSIVVPCIEAIFNKLLIEYKKSSNA